MPPAATRSKSPQRMSLAAIITARMPEPQTLPDGQRAGGVGAAGGERRLARRRLALAGGQHAAHVDLLHLSGLDAAALEGAGEGTRAEGVGGQRRERALERPDGRAGGAQDDDILHERPPWLVLDGFSSLMKRQRAVPGRDRGGDEEC